MATEVKYLSDTWRMIRNCEISAQRAREEVRFLINLIDARIAAAKARGRYADIDDAFNEQPAPAPAKVCYSRFTDRARKVMQFANQEAQRFNHEYVGTEHVLLAVVKVGDGVAAKIIKEHGIDPLKIRLEVEKLVKSGPAMVTMGKPPQTPRVKRAIELAANEATQLGVNYVGDEHILLGLLHDSESVAGSVLASLGMTLDRARSMLRELTCEPEQPAPAPAGDVPEWCIKVAESIGEWSQSFVGKPYVDALAASINHAAESEIARRVAEATKTLTITLEQTERACRVWEQANVNLSSRIAQRDAEIERLKAEAKKLKDTSYCYEIQIGDRRHELRGSATALIHLQNMAAEIERLKAQLAKWESEPVGKMITDLRDEERESKNRDIAKLKAELAEATKTVELESANIREIDGMKMIYLGDAQAAVRCERAARLTQRDAEIERLKAELAEARKPIPAGEPLATVEDFQSFLQRERAARIAAERRLVLTREAWRHRWVDTNGNCPRDENYILTEADLDAAIEAHQKSKADAAGGPQ